MLISYDKFGGIVPRIYDPRLLPNGHSQVAQNCRFDHGGVEAIGTNDIVYTPTNGGGNMLSIFLYQNTYWFGWTYDVDAVLTPISNDSFQRVYYTENGTLKVTDSTLAITGGTNYPMDYLLPSPPAPTHPLVATAVWPTGPGTVSVTHSTGSVVGVGTTFTTTFAVGDTITIGVDSVVISAITDNTHMTTAAVTVDHSGATYLVQKAYDPTLAETRFYTFTYVNGYGDEGPPCLVSNKVTWAPTQTVTLSTSETVPAGKYNLQKVRVYRENQTASSGAQLQFVYETVVANLPAMPTDTVDSSALGEVLATTEWDAAPTGMTGLIPLPNAGLAGFVGNTLCLSVPGFPHAWPVRYQKTTERPIMGLISFGTTVVALTTGLPEAVTFTDPSNSVPEKIPTGHACVSKRSVVDMGAFSIYASPEGLVAIGPGRNELLTKNLFSRDDWQAYSPTVINGFRWQDMYVGFYDVGGNPGYSGFLFDPATGNWCDILYNKPTTAGYFDINTGLLYLITGLRLSLTYPRHLVSFATNAAGLPMVILSRRFTGKPTMLSAAKVLARAYPVSISITYPDLSQTISITASSEAPIRLPMSNGLVENVDIQVSGTNGVTAVYLASEIEELPQ